MLNYEVKARRLRPRPLWIAGKGRYASISDCPPGPTIELFETRERALKARKWIDQCGCGSQCKGPERHLICDLQAS